METALRDCEKATQLPDGILAGNETILLIDHDDTILRVCSNMLKRLGYHVITAMSRKEAIELYRAYHTSIDLVMLDMIMPDKGALDTYEQMKRVDVNVRVLLLSGYDIRGDAAALLEKGCKGFIQKPFGIKALSEKLRAIFNEN